MQKALHSPFYATTERVVKSEFVRVKRKNHTNEFRHRLRIQYNTLFYALNNESI